MTADYDAIVIGAGPSGEVCAGELADGGLRVAVVERELVAGECSFWACIPSKTLLRPGEALQAARDAPGAREAVTGDLDAASALAWRDFMVSDYDDSGQAAWLDSKGITLHRGRAALAGPGEVTVDGETLRAEHIVIATGSDPVIPPIPGIDEIDGLWTNREATGLKEVPDRLIVLGGGPVGVEMAQAIHRLGADVALVEGAEHLLPREPRVLGEGLGTALRAGGIDLHLAAHAARVAPAADAGVEVALQDGTTLRADRLMIATGRHPRTAGLELERAGVALEHGAVPVDARMAAGEGLWAIGDATGIWPLTYVGKYQARIAAANILGTPREANYDAVPRVIFTDPQAASVGTADGALESTVPLSGVARTSTYTRAYAEEPWFARLVSDGERLTGACALGPEAGEWLQQATLAIRGQVPLEVLRDVIQPFPTFSEVFVEALAGLEAPVAAAA